MLPDDCSWLRWRNVVAWFPFRLVGDGGKTLQQYLFPSREPESSAHWRIMPEVTIGRQPVIASAEGPALFWRPLRTCSPPGCDVLRLALGCFRNMRGDPLQNEFADQVCYCVCADTSYAVEDD